MQIPLVALGIWLANVRGGVQDPEAPTFEAIVPLLLPKEYSRVCVVLVLTRLV